ncbi:MAG: aminopeptidase N, partial [Bdellovibrionaceae bacterium]|nr:aminopeptidase N [Pseudobdellovibrionaceae bacterium]
MDQTRIYLKDYTAPDFAVDSIHLDFNLNDDFCLVQSTMQIQRTKAQAPLILDGISLELVSIKIDGQALTANDYQVTPETLTISRVPEQFRLEITTRLQPQLNTSLEGLYRSNDCFVTQCEAQSFRHITYFLDRPDVMTRYPVRIEADKKKYPVLLSNGDRVNVRDLGNGRHEANWKDPHKKPCYLFALVAGDLGVIRDTFTTSSGRKVNLEVYAAHGKQARCHHAMESLKKSMAWDEKAFGREYDLNDYMIVAIDDFNAGAMENKGLNIFNDKYILADSDTATDADFANVEAIVAHEYFHNWTGNRITCRDWFQLCLKEGLTVFRDHEFSADQRERTVRRIADVKGLKAQQFPEDQGPLAHPVRPRRYREINNFYTATVYQKGSEIVRMLRTLIGAENFRAGMDLYFKRHDGQAVTIEDFLRAFADASGSDLSQFALWYHQAGTPHVDVKTDYDPDSQQFTVELEQAVAPTPSETRKRLLHIPLEFGLVGPDGDDVEYCSVEGGTVQRNVIHLKRRRQIMRFNGVKSRPVLSINRGFSAPVMVTTDLDEAELLHLAMRDSDGFARWQALNDVLLAWLKPNSRRRAPGTTNKDMVRALGLIANDASLAPSFRALLLSLPTESDISRELATDVRPDAV